jgi:hypothetical protein
MVELQAEVAVLSAQDGARVDEKAPSLVGSQEVPPQEEHAPLLAGVGSPRPALDERRERVVDLLPVSLGVLVQEDEVRGEALQTPGRGRRRGRGAP